MTRTPPGTRVPSIGAGAAGTAPARPVVPGGAQAVPDGRTALSMS